MAPVLAIELCLQTTRLDGDSQSRRPQLTQPSTTLLFHLKNEYGPVKASPLPAEGPLPGSNNTGELKALIEQFDYLLYYSEIAVGSSIAIYTDSSYARNLILGSSLPASHLLLVSLAQQYYAALRCILHVKLLSVPAHEGIPGNGIADRLAKQGVYSRCSVGRFSSLPAASLSPPEVGFNVEQWTSKTIES